MDIARPDVKRRKRRRQILISLAGLVLLTVVTVALSRIEPAAPKVDAATIWRDTVKRGLMIRQVRGNGTLVPEKIMTVQSDTGGTVEDILVWPGARVEPQTVLLILRNPLLIQEAFDLEWQVKASEARREELRVKLQGDRLSQEATITNLQYQLEQAQLEAEASEKLAAMGLEPELVYKANRTKAAGLEVSYQLEIRRVEMNTRSAAAQLAVQEADLEKLRASFALKQSQVEALKVKAGIAGVLQQVGDESRLQIGQRVTLGTTLAKVVRPDELMAEIKIPETQAKDIKIGQKAEIDTRNGIIPGRVSRIDPSVISGTVTVDVTLEGALPPGARPDLSVDGTIELERLENALHVARMVHGQSFSTVGVFKVTPDAQEAVRIPVQLGRSSVSTIEIQAGLKVGDEIILSDMSQWDEYDRIRLN